MTAPQLTAPRRGRPSASQRAYAERTVRTLARRKVVNAIMVGLTCVAALIATLPLLFILFYLLRKGAAVITPEFFTAMPLPIGEEGGGMANAIVGTVILVGLAMLLGLPIGVGAGLYLAEHRGTRLATVVRFLSDVLNGLPSIVMGIFAWQFLVRPMGHFSAWAGGVALGAMMIPMVTRTTEEMVRLVPIALREAALALGYTRWRTSLTIVLRTAAAGIVTGALVAIARIAGETAPLLFTIGASRIVNLDLIDGPGTALSAQIFQNARLPFVGAQDRAWGAALTLIVLVFVLTFIARAVAGRFKLR